MSGRAGTRAVRVIVVNDDPGGPPRLRGILSAVEGVEVAGETGNLGDALALVPGLEADLLVLEAGAATTAALQDVRAADLPCRIVVTASTQESRLLLAAVQAGATGFVSGPDRDVQLVEAIAAVHRGESVVPSSMLGSLLTDLIQWGQEHERALVEVGRLSSRQRDVLLLLASGASLGAMAAALDVSVYTIRSHIQETLRKLRVHSRSEAVSWARRNGVLDELRRDVGLQTTGVTA